MKPSTSLSTCFVLFSFAVSFSAFGNEAKTIVDKLIDSRINLFESVSVRMRLLKADGTEREEPRLFSVSTYSPTRDVLKSLIIIKDPASLRNAKILTVASDGDKGQWLYLPSSKKVTRLNADSGDDSVFDSDLSFSDLKGENFDDFEYSMGDDRYIQYAQKECGEPAYSIIAKSKNKKSASICRSRVLSISKSKLTVCDVACFNSAGKPIKKIQNLEFIQKNKRWRPARTVVTSYNNSRKVISKTELNYFDWKFSGKGNDSIFSPDALGR